VQIPHQAPFRMVVSTDRMISLFLLHISPLGKHVSLGIRSYSVLVRFAGAGLPSRAAGFVEPVLLHPGAWWVARGDGPAAPASAAAVRLKTT